MRSRHPVRTSNTVCSSSNRASLDGVVDEVRQQLPVNVWGVRDLYFGGLHAVSSSGEHYGDPRRGGSSTAVN